MRRLRAEHQQTLRRLLLRDPVVNLFLLGFLDNHPVVDDGVARWFGEWAGGEGSGALVAVAMVIPGRLAVPYAVRPASMTAIASAVRRTSGPCMTVGPRAASDVLWKAWAGTTTPIRFYDQRLYRLDDAPQLGGGEVRLARRSEWETISNMAAAMSLEDLGVDQRAENPAAFEAAVRDRIERQVTWVSEADGRLAFIVNVGTRSKLGCQIGGTYVPPALRGRGIAKRSVAEVCRRLLDTHPLVTLHANEANTPAIRTYERVGFLPVAPFRLITV